VNLRVISFGAAVALASLASVAHGGFMSGWVPYSGTGTGIHCGSTIDGLCGGGGICDPQTGAMCSQHCRSVNGVLAGVSCDDTTSHP
jgi:hypothetical protein